MSRPKTSGVMSNGLDLVICLTAKSGLKTSGVMALTLCRCLTDKSGLKTSGVISYSLDLVQVSQGQEWTQDLWRYVLWP
jgi:hypothetical protein